MIQLHLQKNFIALYIFHDYLQIAFALLQKRWAGWAELISM